MAPTIEAVLNAALSIPFTFEDDFGALVTGKVNGDFAKAAYLASAPATTATPTVAAVSGQSGDYAVTVPANGLSVAGLWRVNASCLHSDGVTYRFGWNVQVKTAAQADPVAYLAGASVELVSPLSADGGTLRLIQGDSYAAAQSRSLSWTLTGQPDLTTATLTLTIVVKGVTVAKTPLTGTNLASGAPTITATLTKIETAGFDPVIGVFDLSAAIGSDEITLVRGRVYVEADV
jgi:hypothetical protein